MKIPRILHAVLNSIGQFVFYKLLQLVYHLYYYITYYDNNNNHRLIFDICYLNKIIIIIL